MKKRLFAALTALLLLSGCAAPAPVGEGLTVLTTTYPVYLFASALTDGVDGVAVERLDTGSVSCLHDYTLSVRDMKKIEGADVIALNGLGLEEFMEDALGTSSAAVIDCSEEAALLENPSHDHHEEDEHDHGHYDPHIWLDPANAVVMLENLCAGLSALDPDNAELYRANRDTARDTLESCDAMLTAALTNARSYVTGLVTFHDGFRYFANAFDLPLLAAIEEEAGSEASAKEIAEITALVEQNKLPVIFTEVNGSSATADAIARETGCAVAQLTMLMDGPDEVLSNYTDALLSNVSAIVGGFAGEEAVSP